MCSNDSSIQAAKRLNNSPPNRRFTERITNNADTHVDCTNYTGGLVNCAAIVLQFGLSNRITPFILQIGRSTETDSFGIQRSKVTPVTHVPQPDVLDSTQSP